MRIAGLEWEDVTSYSRNDSEREPRTWEVEFRNFRIGVTRKHGIPDLWFGYAHGCIDQEAQLEAENLKSAIEEWVVWLQLRLESCLNTLNGEDDGKIS